MTALLLFTVHLFTVLRRRPASGWVARAAGCKRRTERSGLSQRRPCFYCSPFTCSPLFLPIEQIGLCRETVAVDESGQAYANESIAAVGRAIDAFA